MESGIEVLLKEKEELSEKLEKLQNFIWEGGLSNVPLRQRKLLLMQERVMREYLSILEERAS